MRVLGALYTAAGSKTPRQLQREPVPFQQLLPLNPLRSRSVCVEGSGMRVLGALYTAAGSKTPRQLQREPVPFQQLLPLNPLRSRSVCVEGSGMRVLGALYTAAGSKTPRRPQREPVPFQQLLPLQLKNSVSGKSDRTNEASCLQELSVMFACFKKNEFDQAKCSSEVTSFQKCYKEHKEKSEFTKAQARKGILVPGERKLTHRQVNKLLRRFPAQTEFHKKAEP